MMPGRIVDDEHDVGVLRGGICPADIPHVPGKRGWHVALPGGPLHLQAWSVAPLYHTCGQATGDHIEGPEDIDEIMTIQVAHYRSVPFEP
jgi:hypothetical protein